MTFVLPRMLRYTIPRVLRATRTPRISPRFVHNLPFVGPPTYDTICRRLFSGPDPQIFLAHQKLAVEKNHVDIHDLDPDNDPNPIEHDVLISDIDYETLRCDIAGVLGLGYLSKVPEPDASKPLAVGNGYIHGLKKRLIIPLTVKHGSEARWVFFIVNTGCPHTYLSIQASESLSINEPANSTPVLIGGYRHAAYQSPLRSHFGEVNILGMDYCHLNDIFQVVDHHRRRFKLYFDQGGKMPWPEPKS